MEGTVTETRTPEIYRNKDENKVYVKADKLLPFFKMGDCMSGHSDEVTCIYVETRKESSKIYSGSLNGEVIVWDREVVSLIS